MPFPESLPMWIPKLVPLHLMNHIFLYSQQASEYICTIKIPIKLNLQTITCNLSLFVIIVSLLSSSPSPNLAKKITKKCNARQKSLNIPTTVSQWNRKTTAKPSMWAYKELTKKLKKMIKNVTNTFIQWNGIKVNSMKELYHQSSTLFDFYRLKTSSKEVDLKMCEQLSSLFIIDFTFDLHFNGTSRGTHTHLISHCKCCRWCRRR